MGSFINICKLVIYYSKCSDAVTFVTLLFAATNIVIIKDIIIAYVFVQKLYVISDQGGTCNLLFFLVKRMGVVIRIIKNYNGDIIIQAAEQKD